ncbi:hypothetical protein WJ0W_004227 [Paenibacillus melissococcoides]|uniref:Uncharacterized protein n=1 Tax=Paenibacillus melissococcoides TaxID=2912268 RepID=A0ABN8U777_9BACL|nr:MULTISPECIES: hypothetical protein [Paenibacillus]MEB9894121.1 hypothetical protein [Bacillus cereus]CAH8246994.1 hypothetical protein WJ0W_004227 [Paenibacillus melissococcoides]CAH8716426.1 hypothetical protein HTL2_004600 [Paenibacillus melissococcoides]CAH8717410.1 hypothetical protein WDD9_004873 [Paenibacillus melissococcoides]GIO76595.1 hypothetical protein J6TS7_02050 [Paenibacillus dendritiformis]
MVNQWTSRALAVMLCFILTWSTAGVLGPAEAQAKPSYPEFNKVASTGPVIPGLNAKNEWVPQGLAVVPGKNWVVVSHYSGKSSSQASAISITDTKTKKRIKTLYLYESASKKHTGHVGGVAASAKYLWIASGRSVYQIPMGTISGKKDYSNVVMKKFALGHKASYASYADGVLWIGEYMDGQDIGQGMCKPGPKGKARGYKLNGKGQLPSNPKASYTWTTPDRVQGMALTKNRVFYSQSCGRNNDSTLLVYTRGASGKKVSSLKMPPMSEGISLTGSSLYVLFESGARKYANGKYPLKNMYIINTKKLKL